MNFSVTILFLRLIILFFFSCLLGLETDCIAQSSTQFVQESPALSGTVVSVQAIDNLIAEIAANSSLEDTQKADLKQRLDRAKQAHANAEALAAKSAELKKQSTNVAQRIAETKSKLEQAESKSPEALGELSSGQLTSQISDLEIQLTPAAKRAQELDVELTRRQTRLNEIPEDLASANKELESTLKQQSQVDAPNESASETKARKLWLAARENELRQTVNLLNQERTTYASTTELLPLQQQLADKTVSQLRASFDRLKKAQTERKREQAAETVKATQSLVNRVPDSLKDLAQSNVDLAESQRKLISDAALATSNVTEIETAKDSVTKELATSTQRVDAIGLTDALGTMFRKRRDDFQELAHKFQPDLSVREKIESYQTESFRWEDEIDENDQMLSELDSPDINWESEEINLKALSETDAKWVLLKKRGKLLNETLQAQNSLMQSVINSDTRRRELSTAIEKYQSFVNRRLFWTRSAPLVSVSEFEHFPSAVAWVVAPDNWGISLRAIGRSFRISPLRSLLVSIIALGLIVWRSRTRRFIIEQGKLADRADSTFRPTWLTLLASVLAASAWPVVFVAIAYLLTNGAVDQVAQAVGTALGVVAIFVASRELLREICRDEGLADAHLDWSKKLRRYLRFHLHWYTFFGAACIFLMVMLNAHPELNVRTFSTRMMTTILFFVIAAFHHVVFRSKSPLYADIVQANPDSTIYRRRKLMWAVLVLLPLSFSVLALAGYLDTVFRLGRLVQYTLLWLLVVLLMLALVYRWISIHRRDVSRRQAIEAQRKRLAAAVGVATDSEIPETDSRDELEIADLPALDHKTRQTAWVLAVFIAIVGLVVLWRDILPAIELFGELKAWDVGTGDAIETVTLLDLLISGLVIFGLFFAARNFVSLLELVILSRTSLDSGSRYAMSMILQYVLFIIGAVVVFKLLSIPFQQLSWLLAAASVGIGFGLQEIIANFVCGIILLLERPVRVGDVVTIGETTGSVSRIQMRATTVTNWDRKELVIPNKDLITGKVLNWSLSNIINRMTLEVGVQYGADPDKIRDLLKEVVAQHSGILKDPAPAINLESFGDSALNFVIRFYLPNLDNRISITHEVNTAIARALAKAEIEIPFPQRDVSLSIVSDQEAVVFPLGNGKSDKA